MKRGLRSVTERADEVSFPGDIAAEKLRRGGKEVVLTDEVRKMRLSDGIDGELAVVEVVARRRRQIKRLQRSILLGHSWEGYRYLG